MSAPQPERAKRYDTIDERSLPAKLAAPYALVDLRLMNEAAISAERLRAMFLKRKAKTPESDALWHGQWALRAVARKHAEQVKKDGMLLFAAPDGKVMQLAMQVEKA